MKAISMGFPLEYGYVYFYSLPGEGAEGQFCAVLNSHEKQDYRMLVFEDPVLPDPHSVSERYWAHVHKVARRPAELSPFLKNAKAIGSGLYCIAYHRNHTHFAYLLEDPTPVGIEQEKFNVQKQASYRIAVKNPDRNPIFREGRRARYPESLRGKFGEHRFINLHPAGFLHYTNAEIVLISTPDNSVDALGIDLHDLPVPRLKVA